MDKQLILEKYIKVAVRKALKEQEEQQKRAEKSLYTIYRFPGLKELMEDLMSPAFGRFLKHVDIVAPKPTTFDVKLINGQEFNIIYIGKGKFTVKVSGKKYNPYNLGELERASQSIADLLQLNYAPEEGKEQPAEGGGDEEIGKEIAAAEKPAETPEEKPAEEETPPPVAEVLKKKAKTLKEMYENVLKEVLEENTDVVSSEEGNIESSLVTKQEIEKLKNAFESVKEEYGQYMTVFSLFDPQSLGTISEVLLAKLLSKKGIPAEHVGEKQELADLKVNNHPISLKTSGSKNKINLGSGIINTKEDKEIGTFLYSNIADDKISMQELKSSYPDIYKNIQTRLNEIIRKVSGDDKHFFVWIEKIGKKIKNKDKSKNIITDIIIHTIKLTTKELQDTFDNSYIYATPKSGWGLKNKDGKIIVGADVSSKNLNIHPNLVRQYSKDKIIPIKLIEKLPPSIDELNISDELLDALKSVYSNLKTRIGEDLKFSF